MERKSPRDENPYLSARREYGDRYGSAVRDAATWRRFCMGTLVLLAVFGGGMLWLASTNKVVPYIVQVDKQGYAVAIKPGTQVENTDPKVIMAAVGRFIVNLRTTVSDVGAQNALIKSVYDYIADGSSAQTAVGEYYSKADPFGAAQGRTKATRQVQIKTILPEGRSGKAWQVLWTEEAVDEGLVTERSAWRAIITIALSPVQDLSDVLKNPLGIYVVDINVARDIS
ncbi:conjugal transfer protein [Jonquetella anthropi E3_33 E1]|nr:conjugal transfer protein [Jonquetella anthropi E3_33 E1]